MASKKTLNAANLAALGAERLAALLMEVSEGNAAIKRRLRLELVGEESTAELEKEIRKRLATIARSRSFVDWQNRKALVDDLETQRRAIVQQVGQRSPRAALELTWQFLDLAGPVFARCDDGSGTIAAVFRAAVVDLRAIAQAARPDPQELADQVFRALGRNDYGQYDGLIHGLQAALGPAGLEHLKQRMLVLSAEPVEKPAAKERQVIGWASSGPIYADEIAERSGVSTVKLALRDIADAQGDVDAYIGQYEPKVRKVPKIAADIATRLVAAGRAEEAWQTIAATEHGHRGWPDFEWEDARIDVLEALGHGAEAQESRRACFEATLSVQHLRDYLKRLPDFDDFEAEQRALDHAERYDSLPAALAFLVAWPALERAARLVTQRAKDLDGDHYEVLTPAAEALAGKYPLAATLLLRAMIDFALTRARSSRYGHAARHLRTCEGLAAAIPAYGACETHEAYVAKIRREHGRKTGFWSAVG